MSVTRAVMLGAGIFLLTMGQALLFSFNSKEGIAKGITLTSVGCGFIGAAVYGPMW